MSELKIIQSETSLEQSLEQYFHPFEEKAKEWMDKAQSITITDASQLELMEAAREARLALRRIRLDVADTHKELKEESLRRGQLLDKIKRRLTDLITPIEERLEDQEKFVERQEAKRKEELYQSRLKIALEVMGDQAKTIALGDLDEMVFNNMIEGYKLQAEKRKKEEEQKRKAAEEEQARLREESILNGIGIARLREFTNIGCKNTIKSIIFEFPEKDKSTEMVFEPDVIMGLASLEKDKFDDLLSTMNQLSLSRAKFHAEIREKERKDAEEQKKKFEAEREVRLKLEREESERKAKEEEEKKRKAAEERKLRRGPDKNKLEAFIDELKEFKSRVPKMKDDEAQVIASNIIDLLTKIEVYAIKQIDKL